LPARLTEVDLRQFFQLTSADIAAIRERFRPERCAAVGLQLVCLRAFGRPLDRFAAVPRNLLQYVCEAFSAPLLSIASLRTLYQRRPTLYEHQQWVKEHLGIKPFDVSSQAALLEMLRVQAAAAADVDELVTTAQRWLYDRCRLIPGQRQITDMARHAFSAYEAQMLAAVNRAVPAATLQHCMESVRSPRADGSATHLEWIKAPSRRNGPKNLAETLDKIRYLKSLAVHEWNLDDIALPKLRAYAQKVQARRPAKTKTLKKSTQALELVCFLRMSLLELTDIAMHQTSRRSQDLFRRAASTAQSTHTRSAMEDRQQALKAKAVLQDKSKSTNQRVDEALKHLAVVTDAAHSSFASHVRAALTGDHRRIHGLLSGLEGLEFGGRENDPGFANLKAWRDLQTKRLNALPGDFSEIPLCPGRQDYLAHALVRLHAPVRIGGPGQREHAVHHRHQSALSKARQPAPREARHHLPLDLRRTRFHHRADDLQMAVKQPLQRQLGTLCAAKQADLHQPAAIGQRQHVTL